MSRWLGSAVFMSVWFGTAPLCAQPSSGVEARWSQFRGPGSQGIARAGMKLPAVFGPDKNVLWQTRLPRGHSSPCVWDDHIYVTGGDPKTQRLETLCLERKSGKILWRREAPVKSLEPVHQLNSLASSTPATDGKRVYVYFGSYGLLCYDRDGAEKWRRPLAPIPGNFGSGSSPVVVEGLVLLNSGKGKDFSLLALDAHTGNIVWQKDRPRGEATGLWSTPVVRRAGEGHEVLVVGGEKAVAYNLADGAERWRLGGLPTISLNTPALMDGLAYFSLTNPIGEAVNVLKLPAFDEAFKHYDKNKDGKMSLSEFPEDTMTFGRGRPDKVGDWNSLRSIAELHDRNQDKILDREEWEGLRKSLAKAAAGVQIGVLCVRLDGTGEAPATHVVWKQTKSVPEVPSPLCYQGRVYLVSDRGIVTCRDAKTGKEIYRERLDVRGTCYASPVVGDGKIYAACDRGVVVVLKAGDQFEVLASINFDEPILATPALVDGRIYLRTENRLFAFGG